MTNSTQYSLLDRLQSSRDNAEAWTKFVHIYAPLLEEWTRRLQVPSQDRQDVIQETFVKLLTKLNAFQRSTGGSFRAWLFTMLRNCWLDKVRKRVPAQPIAAGHDPAEPTDPQQVIEREEYQQYVLRRVYNLIMADFPQVTRIAFDRYVIHGQPATEVSNDLGISTNALYLIRSRVLRRLKAELAGLTED